MASLGIHPTEFTKGQTTTLTAYGYDLNGIDWSKHTVKASSAEGDWNASLVSSASDHLEIDVTAPESTGPKGGGTRSTGDVTITIETTGGPTPTTLCSITVSITLVITP